jgi:hypothetical protein
MRPLATPSGIAINHFISVTSDPTTKRVERPIRYCGLGRRLGLRLCRLPPIVDALLAQRFADGPKVVDDCRHASRQNSRCREPSRPIRCCMVASLIGLGRVTISNSRVILREHVVHEHVMTSVVSRTAHPTPCKRTGRQLRLPSYIRRTWLTSWVAVEAGHQRQLGRPPVSRANKDRTSDPPPCNVPLSAANHAPKLADYLLNLHPI